MVLIEYEAKDTAIHRLDSLSKVVWLGSIVVLLALYVEPQPLPILIVFIIVIGYLCRVSWSKLLARAWWAYLGSVVAGFTISLWITSPSQLVHIPAEFGTRIILEITSAETPILGHMAITYAGMLWALASTLKIAIAVTAACIFTYTTPLSEIVSLVDKVLPYKISFVMMAGVRFYPVLIEKVNTIIDAARSRGWSASSANPIRNVLSLSTVVYPSIREAMQLADRMSLAVEARAFGAMRPTSLRKTHIGKSDVFFMLSSVSIAVALAYMWWFYGFGSL